MKGLLFVATSLNTHGYPSFSRSLLPSLSICVLAPTLEGYSKASSMIPTMSSQESPTQNATSSTSCPHLTLIFLILSFLSCLVAYLVGSRSFSIVSDEDPIRDSALLSGTSRLSEGKM